MKIGDILTLRPTIYGKDCEAMPKQEARVVYIHPKNRFYVVEFRASVTGQAWRETFYFPEREGLGYNPGAHNKNWRTKGKKT